MPRTRMPPLLLALVMFHVLPCVSCGSTRSPELRGGGILSVSREVPPGVELVESPPNWTRGDRFVYRKGGKFRYEFRVLETDETGYVLLDESSGAKQKLTRELAETERAEPEEGSARRKDPFDAELSWPLWVGKRWTCQYIDKIPGKDGLPVTAEYHCDATEEVRAPAGTFRCFRIWRNAKLKIPGGNFFDNAAVLWYSPEVGWFVRRLEDGTLRELESYHRQGRIRK
ncbi:MAG: hypothetical protein ACE5F1_22175 [Planctomycetota bacterium]